jgi:uncharacterized membrane protein
MYALVRRWWGRSAGLIAGLIYAYAPYRLLDLYVRASFAEYVALSLLPLVLLAFWNLIERGGLRRLALAALAYAAVILAHTVTGVTFTPLLGAFIVFSLAQVSGTGYWVLGTDRRFSAGHQSLITDHPSLLHRLGLAIAAVLLALGLSGIFLLPMLVERHYVVQEQLVRTTYAYQQHFVYLHQFLSPFWGYGYAVEGPNDGCCPSCWRWSEPPRRCAELLAPLGAGLAIAA